MPPGSLQPGSIGIVPHPSRAMAASSRPDGFNTIARAGLAEIEEMDIAAELLAAQSASELDRTLVRAIHSAKQPRGRGLHPFVTRSLGGLLKSVVRQVLPTAGRPDAARAGVRLSSSAGEALGVELEGLSPEDQEFEAARGLVRLGSAAAELAARYAASAPVQRVATRSFFHALREHAPGLAPVRPPATSPQACKCHAAAGRWERRGPDVILYGL